MSITLPPTVAVMLYFGLNIILRLQKFKIYTDVYDVQLHHQNFMRAKNDWMAGRIWPAGRSFDTPGLACPRDTSIFLGERIVRSRSMIVHAIVT